MIGMPMLVLLLGRARTRDVRRRSIEYLLPAKMSCPSNVNIRRTGRKVLNHLERILPNRTGAFDGDVSSGFRDQRLQAFELAAPDRLHVPITARVPRLGRILIPTALTCMTSICDPPESSTPYPGLAGFRRTTRPPATIEKLALSSSCTRVSEPTTIQARCRLPAQHHARFS